ncbi:acid sphingomyelinase-like phosphodiesterase 3a [Cylas formicarius]|uniref:acid sphingomyelinase-like phosphodiesterase 3a n=1 Tax=Cylas formicarius TaxID=197179 RepID=UPI0029588D7A|nr:acid sphingomyelinase-like phosphodiesterase 3a [Cylas formicarius]
MNVDLLWPVLLGQLLCGGVLAREMYERDAYFWHITDIHYDGHFNSHADIRKGCWRPEYDGNNGKRPQRKPLGPYGDYSCDSTWELIESASRTMMSRQSDNVEFVLWTGDGLSKAIRHLPESRQMETMQNLTDLLRKTFTSQFVFPALGHDDPMAKKELGKMWAQWLPTDAMKTFEAGGYYEIERKSHKLQIVVLNTNLMKRPEEKDEDAMRQWDWLENVLEKFKRSGLTVYLVGHIPPGRDERHKGPTQQSHFMYTNHHNTRYLKIVRQYSSIIVGQFFGHWHSDTFRVMYDNNKNPVSWAMLAPSVTPKRTHDGPNNPGLRLYKFDKDTGQVFDYCQYYLDLSSANFNGKAEWVVEYNFSTYYGISDINPANLHSLAEKLTQPTQDSVTDNNSLFNKYYRANSVKINSRTSNNCDVQCIYGHYCAITKMDFDEHDECLRGIPNHLNSATAHFEDRFSLVALLLVLCHFCVCRV